MKLKYEDGSTSVEIADYVSNTRYIDVNIRLSSFENIMLKMEYEAERNRIYIEDLTGNGYYSKLQRKGYGSLAVNCAVEYLKNTFPPNVAVYGEVSPVGDPENIPEKEECQTARIAFWKSFGFSIVPGKRIECDLEGCIGNVKIKTGGNCENGLPRYIPLHAFSEVT